MVTNYLGRTIILLSYAEDQPYKARDGFLVKHHNQELQSKNIYIALRNNPPFPASLASHPPPFFSLSFYNISVKEKNNDRATRIKAECIKGP